jgi:hypothetical protein
MKWIPRSDVWFSYLRIDTTAGELKHDLAIDATGRSEPSPVAAGLQLPVSLPDVPENATQLPWVVAILGGLTAFIVITRALDRV